MCYKADNAICFIEHIAFNVIYSFMLYRACKALTLLMLFPT